MKEGIVSLCVRVGWGGSLQAYVSVDQWRQKEG